jgi:hypothetical protein
MNQVFDEVKFSDRAPESLSLSLAQQPNAPMLARKPPLRMKVLSNPNGSKHGKTLSRPPGKRRSCRVGQRSRSPCHQAVWSPLAFRCGPSRALASLTDRVWVPNGSSIYGSALREGETSRARILKADAFADS